MELVPILFQVLYQELSVTQSILFLKKFAAQQRCPPEEQECRNSGKGKGIKRDIEHL